MTLVYSMIPASISGSGEIFQAQMTKERLEKGAGYSQSAREIHLMTLTGSLRQRRNKPGRRAVQMVVSGPGQQFGLKVAVGLADG